jgi:transaldolase/glucose-6-phosphate isomerase
MHQISYTLPAGLAVAVEQALDDWQANDKVARLWQRDASLWTGDDEGRWLGWLTIVEEQLDDLAALETFCVSLPAGRFSHIVLLGMGGSSMAPEVLRDTFGELPGKPRLLVLDSTDPDQISAVETAVTLQGTMFIVASKSGSTLEPNILEAYFYQRMVDTVGPEQASQHFIAITDPGSSIERHARDAGFKQIFNGKPDIGGRFSALSNFGMVPAAIGGVDVRRLLNDTLDMVTACAVGNAAENPGVLLGCIMGVAALQGRDKLTLIASPGLASIGAWLEQLIAESTGKQGKGIIPVDGEPIGEPGSYSDDRLFVYLCLHDDVSAEQGRAVELLEKSGQPVIRINVAAVYQLGQEFFRWEMATAVAGAILGIHPFNQPDVEASKIETRKLMDAYESGHSLPVQSVLAGDGVLTLHSDSKNIAELQALCGEAASAGDIIKAHLDRVRSGDYVAVLAYVARNEAHTRLARQLCEAVRRTKKVATCLGFGPRFLHSTGQAYKGGPNSGVFLQLTSDAVSDLPVPGKNYSFGVVETAQARGDFDVLAARGRRVLHIHLGGDVGSGLEHLIAILEDTRS